MFDRIKIQNFRGLRNLSVELKPLTVLVGPNDTGKSSFLDALNTIGYASNIPASDHWRAETMLVAEVAGYANDGSYAKVSSQTNRSSKDKGTKLGPVQLFRLPAHGIEMECEGYPDHGPPPNLDGDGKRVPALIDYFLRRDLGRLNGYKESVREIVNGLNEIQIATPQPSRRRIDLVIEDGLRIPAEVASVGVRLVLFFLALAYHPSPPRIILIDEPENGVHPRRLQEIVRILRELTQGKHADYKAQIILSTHSPYLLDYVDLATDQVLVFKRNDDGSRTCEPADAERLKLFLDEFMLGEIWYTQGEEGLVAKKA